MKSRAQNKSSHADLATGILKHFECPGILKHFECRYTTFPTCHHSHHQSSGDTVSSTLDGLLFTAPFLERLRFCRKHASHIIHTKCRSLAFLQLIASSLRLHDQRPKLRDSHGSLKAAAIAASESWCDLRSNREFDPVLHPCTVRCHRPFGPSDPSRRVEAVAVALVEAGQNAELVLKTRSTHVVAVLTWMMQPSGSTYLK